MIRRISLFVLVLAISSMISLFAQTHVGEKGDVNGDGAVNVIDAVWTVNIILEISHPTEEELCAADVNGDGAINVLDVIRIVNHILYPEQDWFVESCDELDCDDENPCTEDYCDDFCIQCRHTNLASGSPCDDGDACTDNDQCIDGQCQGSAMDCDDGNSCTEDSCDPDEGCIHREVCCENGTDDDGDGNDDCDDDDCLVDTDHDGYSAPPCGNDCNDGDASIHPGATESCNGKDDDCDLVTDEEGAAGCTVYYRDDDNDGYGKSSDSKCLCAAASPYDVTQGGECDDSDASVHPGTTEICNDTKDNDCDGQTDCGDSDCQSSPFCNTPPIVSFTVDPSSGTTLTTFNVDASASTDDQDPTSALQVRWDWENDGTYDTDWSTTKAASHQHYTTGTKIIKLEVKDTGELTDTETKQVAVDFVRCGTVTDIDGNVYQTVVIGNQCWMAENLKVTHYRSGDAIPNVTDSTEWVNLTTGAYCNYDDDVNSAITYGRLYNWYTASDNRKVAPAGWHVPSDEEWKQLEMCLGMSQSEADRLYWRGTDEGGKIKEAGTAHWNSPNAGATNESGFTALPAGFRHCNAATYCGMGTDAFFWCSTELLWVSVLVGYIRLVDFDGSDVYHLGADKPNGLSIRCVKNAGNTPPIASFTIDPSSGTTVTTFNVDASASTDIEDAITVLQVRWDWENDGTYDTDWTTTKIASHFYSYPGTITIKLEVKDTGGLTDTEIHQVTVSCGGETVADIDGNVYCTVTIGTQVWMAENLRVTHYRNGDAIPNVTDNIAWGNLASGAYCNYENDVSNSAIYGRLYNWYSLVDSRNIAPEGWHVPSNDEWNQLEMSLGVSQSEAEAYGWRGADMGGRMKRIGTIEGGDGLWHAPNTGATNESGFSGLPAGARDPSGNFALLNYRATFWSTSECVSGGADDRNLFYDNSQGHRACSSIIQGSSVRCVKN